MLSSIFYRNGHDIWGFILYYRGFPGGAVVKNLPAKAGDARDVGSIPGLGRSPGGGHGNPLQYPCLENPLDRGAWQATVHIPWIEEPGRLQSIGSQELDTTEANLACTHTYAYFIST